jgi:hypothetical protein
MEHIYKWLGSKQQAKQLWENEEALKKYIARLKDFWDEENECWVESPKNTCSKVLFEDSE